ncbi:MAG: hypothetical protein M3063_10225 [Actinomycetota bacterium]|nr:hypothetical protein [Actinomycetota bacterium]
MRQAHSGGPEKLRRARPAPDPQRWSASPEVSIAGTQVVVKGQVVQTDPPNLSLR